MRHTPCKELCGKFNSIKPASSRGCVYSNSCLQRVFHTNEARLQSVFDGYPEIVAKCCTCPKITRWVLSEKNKRETHMHKASEKKKEKKRRKTWVQRFGQTTFHTPSPCACAFFKWMRVSPVRHDAYWCLVLKRLQCKLNVQKFPKDYKE